MTTRSRMIPLLVLCTFLAHAKDSIPCGSIVSTSLTLHSDIGPCTGPALIVQNTKGDITIDLNGRKITGQGTGTGIVLGTMLYPVTLKGPGEINDFETGVQANTDADALLYDLTLRNNGTGVALHSPLGVARVHSNSIIAGRNGSVGVTMYGQAYVYQNTISGHSKSGIRLGTGYHVITENLLTQNGVGIGPSQDFSMTCFAIRGNRVLGNLSDGINVLNRASIALSSIISGECFQIDDNLVRSNGGNGIVMGRGSPAVLQNNIVQSNRMNGVMLTSGLGSVVKVLGNRIQGSGGTDLLWDSVTSPGVCGMQNVIDTQAQPLPRCLP